MDWIGLDCLFTQRKSLAIGYYTRHPEKCIIDENENNNNMIKTLQIDVTVRN